MNKPSYYAIITAEVRYCKELSSSQKLFFAEITALSQKSGKCWASNKYFAELYEVAKSTISSWVTALEDRGFIEVSYKREGQEIKQRIIKINASKQPEGIQKTEQGIQKTDHPYTENPKGGYSENPKGNNTSKSNNTREGARGNSENDDTHPLQEFVQDELPEVAKLDKQLSLDNCESLIDDFGKTQVHDVLLAMENYNGLTSKYKSVNLTVRGWCRKRNEDKPETKSQPKQIIV